MTLDHHFHRHRGPNICISHGIHSQQLVCFFAILIAILQAGLHRYFEHRKREEKSTLMLYTSWRDAGTLVVSLKLPIPQILGEEYYWYIDLQIPLCHGANCNLNMTPEPPAAITGRLFYHNQSNQELHCPGAVDSSHLPNEPLHFWIRRAPWPEVQGVNLDH